MRAKIEIELDNAAFADDLPGELLRVLEQACTRICRQANRTGPVTYDDKSLRDSNGNTVGTARVEG